MATNFFSKKQLDYTKQRKLRTVDLPSARESTSPITHETVIDTIFTGLSDTKEKADTLLSEIEKAAKLLTVPVPEQEETVRGSVRRLDSTLDGSYITFDLYKRIIISRSESNFKSSEEARAVFNLTTRTEPTPEQVRSYKASDDTSDFEKQFIQSQAIYLYALQMMQAGFQALETQKQTSVKLPPGSETGATISSLVSSVLYLVNYAKNSYEVLRELLKKTSNGSVNVDQIIAAAQSSPTPDDDLYKALMKSKEPEDSSVILDYVHNFLATTTKIGYEPWAAYAATYSEGRELGVVIDTKDRFMDQDLKLDTTMYSLLAAVSTQHSTNLDYTASSLTNREVPISSLCSLRWWMKVPMGIIDLALSVYKVMLFLLGIKWKKIIDGFVEVGGQIGWGLLFGIAVDILEMLSKYLKAFLCWFQRDPAIWAIVEQCPSIAEMIDVMVTAMEDIEAQLLVWLDYGIEQLRKESSTIRLNAQLTAELGRLREMIAKLEYIQKSAARVAVDIKELSEADIGAEVFADAGVEIKLKFKEKTSDFSGDMKAFFKKPFKDSKWLKSYTGHLNIPEDVLNLPDIPHNTCDWDRDYAAKSWSETSAGEIFSRTREAAGNVGSDVIREADDIAMELKRTYK